MKYLQKLGKALMLPVAALPVAGILMGVGYLLAPAVMGAAGGHYRFCLYRRLPAHQGRRRSYR